MNQHALEAYEPVVGSAAIRQLRQIGRLLAGARVVHVNSTRVGGGVAEILGWLIPLMQEVGVDASWEVIDGDDPFFAVTKSVHNGLQGTPVPFGTEQVRTYTATQEANAPRLRALLEAADFVFMHDPQPAGLIRYCPNRKGKWIWRCHIDIGHPCRPVWRYFRELVSLYDASIFSVPLFAQPLPHRQFIIAPSIDPLSEKNAELPAAEIDAVLSQFGLRNDWPLFTQISRFDRFKDPVGVIRAFQLLGSRARVQLLLAGGGATDDPEGQSVFEQVSRAARQDDRIRVLQLPSDAHRAVNALQRAATVIIQKSLQEGFGLTVTEGMWKSKPVIGGNTGGIRLQVHNYHTGFLVDTPEGCALRMRELLRQPKLRARLGTIGREFVRQNFLLTRHLREYLTLMLATRDNTSDYIMVP